MADPMAGIQFRPPPGQPMPSPEQIAQMQQQIAAEAQRLGMTIPQFIEHIKQQQMLAQQQAAQQQQGGHPHHHDHDHDHDHDHEHHNHDHGEGEHGHSHGGPPPGQPQPIRPGPPNPVALALADFLRKQPLKPRTVIFNGERKEMFRVKRALRAIQSPAYEKARAKNPALPEITDRASLENCFKLLPMSMLALRVLKADPNEGHEGHNHGPKKGKRVKGQWNVRIEQQQEAADDMYYIWFYEGSQIMRKVYAVLAIVVIFIVVLYPLWPLVLRQGVYYLSWGFLMLLGLFFLMAIFRVILFCITYFTNPPGLWLFPNLWEDVSFLDSFKPVWAWHETTKPKKKKKKKAVAMNAESAAGFAGSTGNVAPATATTTGSSTQIQTSSPTQRSYVAPRVEELGDEE